MNLGPAWLVHGHKGLVAGEDAKLVFWVPGETLNPKQTPAVTESKGRN